MKVLKSILILLLVLIVFVIASGYAYLKSTAPIYEGELTLQGLKQDVEVYYDSFGIPHIYAANETDAYYALGYVHAQDRLFQMELIRRAANGRLAEVLGEDLVSTDKLFRTLGLNQFAAEHTARFLNTDTIAFQRAVYAYQEGIDEFIRTGSTPIEFTIMGIPKTEFVPEDIYAIIGLTAFGFAEGLQIDPLLEKIKLEWGDAYLKDLAVHTPPNAELIPIHKGATSQHADRLITAVGDALHNLPIPLWMGSNGWVIDGSRTVSGEPILANDTHMGYSQPAVWFEAHLEYPGHRFYGHHLAQVRKETIKVKGEEDVVITVKTSRHGPLVNAMFDKTLPTDRPVSLRWELLHSTSHLLQANYQRNRAKSFHAFERSVSQINAPGLNVMYADNEGAVAWWAAARLPIRPAHFNSKFFLDGSSGADEYLGHYPFTSNPHAINPPWGFVYSANNQPDTVDGMLYPGYYYPRSRAKRIVELLSENKRWTVEAVSKVQLDVTSQMHVDIAKELAEALEGAKDPRFADFVAMLRQWKGEHKGSAVEPSIYYNLLAQTMYHAMIDELGKDAYHAFNTTSISRNTWEIFVKNDQSPWWDDVRTKETKESRTDIVLHAAEHSLELLIKNAGPAKADWQWEKIHRLKHPHALGAVALLDKYFSVGPFGAPGGTETINNYHFDLDTTGIFYAAGGPALRKVTDFGDVENGVTVSPTGQSGNIMSPHYSDQSEMYVKGEVRKMMMNREEIVSKSTRLVLKSPAP